MTLLVCTTKITASRASKFERKDMEIRIRTLDTIDNWICCAVGCEPNNPVVKRRRHTSVTRISNCSYLVTEFGAKPETVATRHKRGAAEEIFIVATTRESQNGSCDVQRFSGAT
jgi:hypothetical protein